MRNEAWGCALRAACLIGLGGFCAARSLAAAPDYEEIVSAKLAATDDGEVMRLSTGSQQFIALFIAASDSVSERAAVILHGMGGHADWPDVIAPLRRSLPAQGWATLSIQLPVLAPGAPWADYGATLQRAPARIGSALACLSQRGYRHIAVIGYGYGATAAAQYLAGHGRGFSAFVGISMHAPPFLDPPPDLPDSLLHVPIPVLDIYGSRDHADILRQADDRRLAGTQNRDRSYEQFMIEGADHDYAGYESALISRIVAWLDLTLSQARAGDGPAGAGDRGSAARKDNGGSDACKTRTN